MLYLSLTNIASISIMYHISIIAASFWFDSWSYCAIEFPFLFSYYLTLYIMFLDTVYLWYVSAACDHLSDTDITVDRTTELYYV